MNFNTYTTTVGSNLTKRNNAILEMKKDLCVASECFEYDVSPILSILDYWLENWSDITWNHTYDVNVEISNGCFNIKLGISAEQASNISCGELYEAEVFHSYPEITWLEFCKIKITPAESEGTWNVAENKESSIPVKGLIKNLEKYSGIATPLKNFIEKVTKCDYTITGNLEFGRTRIFDIYSIDGNVECIIDMSLLKQYTEHKAKFEKMINQKNIG